MSPFRIPLILMLILPIAEIYAFVEIGGQIGGWLTVLWVIASAVTGVVLLRLHGVATIRKVQESVMRGELPARAMFDGMLLFFAAVLLIFPGFITDTLGLLLLLPPLRRLLTAALLGRAIPFPQGHDPHFRRSDTIEGEFRREDEERDRLDRQ